MYIPPWLCQTPIPLQLPTSATLPNAYIFADCISPQLCQMPIFLLIKYLCNFANTYTFTILPNAHTFADHITFATLPNAHTFANCIPSWLCQMPISSLIVYLYNFAKHPYLCQLPTSTTLSNAYIFANCIPPRLRQKSIPLPIAHTLIAKYVNL